MIKLPAKNGKEVDAPTIGKTIWKSTILAMIFTIPALGIFLGVYYVTGNLVLGAILGFGIHFVILAFSGRISDRLVKSGKRYIKGAQ